MLDGFTSGLIRVVRLGVVGIAGAAACFWIGTHTGGLAGFGATMGSLALAAVTLGVVAARTVDILLEERRSEPYVAPRPASGPHRAAWRREACGVCGRRRVQYGAIILCPNCDPHPTDHPQRHL